MSQKNYFQYALVRPTVLFDFMAIRFIHLALIVLILWYNVLSSRTSNIEQMLDKLNKSHAESKETYAFINGMLSAKSDLLWLDNLYNQQIRKQSGHDEKVPLNGNTEKTNNHASFQNEKLTNSFRQQHGRRRNSNLELVRKTNYNYSPYISDYDAAYAEPSRGKRELTITKGMKVEDIDKGKQGVIDAPGQKYFTNKPKNNDKSYQINYEMSNISGQNEDNNILDLKHYSPEHDLLQKRLLTEKSKVKNHANNHLPLDANENDVLYLKKNQNYKKSLNGNTANFDESIGEYLNYVAQKTGPQKYKPKFPNGDVVSEENNNTTEIQIKEYIYNSAGYSNPTLVDPSETSQSDLLKDYESDEYCATTPTTPDRLMQALNSNQSKFLDNTQNKDIASFIPTTTENKKFATFVIYNTTEVPNLNITNKTNLIRSLLASNSRKELSPFSGTSNILEFKNVNQKYLDEDKPELSANNTLNIHSNVSEVANNKSNSSIAKLRETETSSLEKNLLNKRNTSGNSINRNPKNVANLEYTHFKIIAVSPSTIEPNHLNKEPELFVSNIEPNVYNKDYIDYDEDENFSSPNMEPNHSIEDEIYNNNKKNKLSEISIYGNIPHSSSSNNEHRENLNKVLLINVEHNKEFPVKNLQHHEKKYSPSNTILVNHPEQNHTKSNFSTTTSVLIAKDYYPLHSSTKKYITILDQRYPKYLPKQQNNFNKNKLPELETLNQDYFNVGLLNPKPSQNIDQESELDFESSYRHRQNEQQTPLVESAAYANDVEGAAFAVSDASIESDKTNPAKEKDSLEAEKEARKLLEVDQEFDDKNEPQLLVNTDTGKLPKNENHILPKSIQTNAFEDEVDEDYENDELFARKYNNESQIVNKDDLLSDNNCVKKKEISENINKRYQFKNDHNDFDNKKADEEKFSYYNTFNDFGRSKFNKLNNREIYNAKNKEFLEDYEETDYEIEPLEESEDGDKNSFKTRTLKLYSHNQHLNKNFLKNNKNKQNIKIKDNPNKTNQLLESETEEKEIDGVPMAAKPINFGSKNEYEYSGKIKNNFVTKKVRDNSREIKLSFNKNISNKYNFMYNKYSEGEKHNIAKGQTYPTKHPNKHLESYQNVKVNKENILKVQVQDRSVRGKQKGKTKMEKNTNIILYNIETPEKTGKKKYNLTKHFQYYNLDKNNLNVETFSLDKSLLDEHNSMTDLIQSKYKATGRKNSSKRSPISNDEVIFKRRTLKNYEDMEEMEQKLVRGLDYENGEDKGEDKRTIDERLKKYFGIGNENNYNDDIFPESENLDYDISPSRNIRKDNLESEPLYEDIYNRNSQQTRYSNPSKPKQKAFRTVKNKVLGISTTKTNKTSISEKPKPKSNRLKHKKNRQCDDDDNLLTESEGESTSVLSLLANNEFLSSDYEEDNCNDTQESSSAKEEANLTTALLTTEKSDSFSKETEGDTTVDSDQIDSNKHALKTVSESSKTIDECAEINMVDECKSSTECATETSTAEVEIEPTKPVKQTATSKEHEMHATTQAKQKLMNEKGEEIHIDDLCRTYKPQIGGQETTSNSNFADECAGIASATGKVRDDLKDEDESAKDLNKINIEEVPDIETQEDKLKEATSKAAELNLTAQATTAQVNSTLNVTESTTVTLEATVKPNNETDTTVVIESTTKPTNETRKRKIYSPRGHHRTHGKSRKKKLKKSKHKKPKQLMKHFLRRELYTVPKERSRWHRELDRYGMRPLEHGTQRKRTNVMYDNYEQSYPGQRKRRFTIRDSESKPLYSSRHMNIRTRQNHLHRGDNENYKTTFWNEDAQIERPFHPSRRFGNRENLRTLYRRMHKKRYEDNSKSNWNRANNNIGENFRLNNKFFVKPLRNLHKMEVEDEPDEVKNPELEKNTKNMTQEQLIEKAATGDIPRKIMEAVFKQVESNEEFSNNIGVGLNKLDESPVATNKDENTENKEKSEKNARTDEMLHEIMKTINNIVNSQVKDKTCVHLPAAKVKFLQWLTTKQASSTESAEVSYHPVNEPKIQKPQSKQQQESYLFENMSPNSSGQKSVNGTEIEQISIHSNSTTSGAQKDLSNTNAQIVDMECKLEVISKLLNMYKKMPKKDQDEFFKMAEYLECQRDFLNKTIAKLRKTRQIKFLKHKRERWPIVHNVFYRKNQFLQPEDISSRRYINTNRRKRRKQKLSYKNSHRQMPYDSEQLPEPGTPSAKYMKLVQKALEYRQGRDATEKGAISEKRSAKVNKTPLINEENEGFEKAIIFNFDDQ